jgi:hypothetical protein
MNSPDCQQVRTWLSTAINALEEGRNPEMDEGLRAHLADCSECTKEFEKVCYEIQSVKSAFRALALAQEEREDLEADILDAVSRLPLPSVTQQEAAARPQRRLRAVTLASAAAVLLAAAGFLAFWFIYKNAIREAVGTVSQGEVDVLSEKGDRWVRAGVDHNLRPGDTLRTGENDRCRIELPRATIEMEPDTLLRMPSKEKNLPPALEKGEVHVAVREPRKGDILFCIASPAGDISSSLGEFTVVLGSRNQAKTENPDAQVTVRVREGKVLLENSLGKGTAGSGDVVYALRGEQPSQTGKLGFVVIPPEDVASLLDRVGGFKAAKKGLLQHLMDANRIEGEVRRLRASGASEKVLVGMEELLARTREWALNEKRTMRGYLRDLVALVARQAESVCGEHSVLLIVPNRNRESEPTDAMTVEEFLFRTGSEDILDKLPLPMLLCREGFHNTASLHLEDFRMDRTDLVWETSVKSGFLEREHGRDVLGRNLVQVRRLMSDANQKYLQEAADEALQGLLDSLANYRKEEADLCRSLNELNLHFADVASRRVEPLMLGRKGERVPRGAVEIAGKLAPEAFRTAEVRNIVVLPYTVLLGQRKVWEVRCEVFIARPGSAERSWYRGVFQIDATDPGRETVLKESVGFVR